MLAPARLAGQRLEAEQGEGGDRVARGFRAIVRRLLARQQGLVLRRRPEEPAVRMREPLRERLVQTARRREPTTLAGGLEQVHQSGREKSMIFEHARVAAGAAQDAAAFVHPQQRVCGARGALDVIFAREGETGAGEGGDHQAVPGGQDLRVGERRRTARAGRIQLRPDLLQERQLVAVRDARQRKHVASLEIAFVGGAEQLRRPLAVRVAERFAKLRGGPDEERPFFPFAVGVGRRPECSRGIRHLARDVIEHLAGDPLDERLPRRLPALGVRQRQERVVVQHLLEMGDEPPRIGGVAMEPAAHLVVDATERHLLQREPRHRQRLLVPRALPVAEEEANIHGGGELRRAPDASLAGIEYLRVVAHRAVEHVQLGQPGGRVGREAVLHRLGDLLRGMRRAAALLLPDTVEIEQEGGESDPGAPLSVPGREVGACEERLAIRREEHAHRPAALLREQLNRLHVDGIDVRALFAIDLHRDEPLVQHAGDVLGLERLLLHHVTPVAGGVADAEEDGPIEGVRLRERLVPPWAPIDGIVRVLQKIG